jgi:hypothetical protein
VEAYCVLPWCPGDYPSWSELKATLKQAMAAGQKVRVRENCGYDYEDCGIDDYEEPNLVQLDKDGSITVYFM